MANLFQRRSSSSLLCPICKLYEETIEHLFLQCPWVEVIWFGGNLGLRIIRTEITTWANWLLQVYDSAKGSKVVRNNLCNFQFNNEQINPRKVIMASSLSASTFKEASLAPSNSPTLRLPDPIVGGSWTPPNSGFVKINVDASWDCGDGLGFTGVVARDEDGRFLVAGRSGGKATSAAMMEVLAILHGCRMGLNRGWNKIIIESDSMESISCLKNMAKIGSWDAFPTLVKCCRLGKDFLECRWSWVLRLANSTANRLASRHCKEACDLI
ncbi:unnamed protein product [Malus baccata var. baccata]